MSRAEAAYLTRLAVVVVLGAVLVSRERVRSMITSSPDPDEVASIEEWGHMGTVED